MILASLISYPQAIVLGLLQGVSELFPIEIRGMAIALFYATATLCGAVAPSLFGYLVQSGSKGSLLTGYALAASLMLIAAGTALKLGEDAEGRSLESLTS